MVDTVNSACERFGRDVNQISRGISGHPPYLDATATFEGRACLLRNNSNAMLCTAPVAVQAQRKLVGVCTLSCAHGAIRKKKFPSESIMLDPNLNT